jgi:predicted amidophosphoribosyltransferase
MAVKCVIFGLQGTTLIDFKSENEHLYNELQEHISFLCENDIIPIILSNRNFTITDDSDGIKTPIEDWLKTQYPGVQVIITSKERLPSKPNYKIIEYILKKYKLENNEILYVGNNDIDFKTAVNGKFLFLNAIWETDSVDYGIKIKSPKEITDFINVFCLRTHYWHFKYETGIIYYSLAPFSTYKEDYRFYSTDARDAAKFNSNRKDFFLKYLITAIYLSGLHTKFDYIAVVPSHTSGYGNIVMNDILEILGNFFRKNYLIDLVIREIDAVKSQTARIKGTDIDFPLNQMNTIKLNRTPHKTQTDLYTDFSKRIRGKTILLVDDFCTSGASLEVVRNFIEKAGGKCIGVSWLKTINTSYKTLKILTDFNPFILNKFNSRQYRISNDISYNTLMNDTMATNELSSKYRQYLKLKS